MVLQEAQAFWVDFLEAREQQVPQLVVEVQAVALGS
jgi:hypothetical protein